MKKITLIILVPVLLLLLVGCKNSTTAKPQIVTTFEPMYEFTKAIVGDKIEVSNIVPANQEVHDFEPSGKVMTQLTQADVIVYNSNHLESWVLNVKNKGEKIEASDKVDKIGDDPHTWVSPKAAIVEVNYIAEQLAKRYPAYKKDFKKNAENYVAELKKLDQNFEKLQTAHNKKFITQHEAFSYLARDYGLTQISVTGLNPDSEPTGATLVKLKEEMQKNKLHAVYFEDNASSKVAETLAKETGAKLLVLNPVEGLTEQEKKAGESYITVMEENLLALQETMK